MYITEAILLGLALAMDCFAVSITSGAIVKHIVLRPMLTMILSFGLFQGAMVLAGWYVSTLFSRILAPIDHWIAFGLLSAIGIQMIREGFGKKEETKFDPLSYKVILTLAVATSIDAMAVGVSMAFMQIGSSWDTIAIPAVLIAAISSALTIAGLGTGIFIGRKIPCSIAPVGGLILIGIGIKIIIEHLGVVPIPVQLLVLRAEASISKPWTAGVSAGFLWTPWHIITSLSGHNKSPAGEGLPQGFRRFYFVHHNTIIRGDSQSLSFTLMMAATQERAVSCIR